MKWKERLGDITARRQLTIAGTNKKVTILLGKPFQVVKSGEAYNIWGHVDELPKGDWICAYKINGLPKREDMTKSGYNEVSGKDSMAALMNAITVLNSILDHYHPTLHWKYCWGLDTGFPIISEHYALTNRLELQDKFAKIIGNYMRKKVYNKRSPYWTAVMKKEFKD